MKHNNKKLGSLFETELCETLSEHGFWVHFFTSNNMGQPADIIAVRNGKAYLIDAKVCSNDEFPLSRIEENQTLAMELWLDRGNGQGWFALKLNDEVYMLPYILLKAYSKSKSTLSESDIRECGLSIERWVAKCK